MKEQPHICPLCGRAYYKFGVETVQFQYYFAEIMRQRAAAVGEYLPKGSLHLSRATTKARPAVHADHLEGGCVCCGTSLRFSS